MSSQVNRLYRNDEGVLTESAVWSSSEADDTHSVTLGDVDGDGDLDLIAGNYGLRPIRLYRNDGGVLTESAVWSSSEEDFTNSVALGDVDGDGDLDLAVGNFDQPNRLYRNDGGVLTESAVWSSSEADDTHSVALGDMDGDGDLDLVVGNGGDGGGPNRLYRNDGGVLTESAVWSSSEEDETRSVALGDMDDDGDLDLVAGNFDNISGRQANRLYRNDGDALTESAAWSSSEAENTWSVALGDVDGDGDLDLVAGNGGWPLSSPNRLYRNDGGVLTESAVWSSSEDDWTYTNVTLGDVDGNGDLDLIAGNHAQSNRLYQNDEGVLTEGAVWSSSEADDTWSVALGDVDGDGDLDLVAGNLNSQANRLYRNNEGVLTESTVWSSSEADYTWSVALGDVDGDGDLDLVTGNNGSNRLYRNRRNSSHTFSGWDNPTRIRLKRPGTTDDAGFYSTPEIIRSSNVTIEYILADPEEDAVVKILPQYSPNGGGLWLPATPGDGGDGLTNLSTSATGIEHTFVWNAEADLIKNDNVAFRIRAIPGNQRSPIHWPAQPAHTSTFRVEAARWFARVVDENNQSIKGVLLYQDGELLTAGGFPAATDRAGLLRLNEPEAGQPLVGLKEVWQQPTLRNGHDEWAYRVFVTNLNLDDSGNPHPDVMDQALRQQTVTLHQEKPLILFNIVVSIEWDADQAYVETIQRAFKHASDYLYDVTDGQMAFGEVHIFDNREYWADADFQISTKNTVRPYAYVGGIVSDDTAHAIRIGRFWDGESGNLGAWDEKYGYRTLIHEFGHYALHLYDEYYMRTVDAEGRFTGESNAACTGLELASPEYLFNVSLDFVTDLDAQYLSPALKEQFHVNDVDLRQGAYVDVKTLGIKWTIYSGEERYYVRRERDTLNVYRFDDTPTNASIMYYQYNASELAGSDRWNIVCQDTEQHRVNQTSDWGTVVARYADDADPPRWSIRTPTDRGSVMAGPEQFPDDLLPFPAITTPSPSGTEGISREVNVQSQNGAAFPNALVALYTTRQDYTVAIDQGLTDTQGHLTVYGALAGDTIQVASLDGAFAGAAAVDDSLSYEIVLEQTGPTALHAADTFSSPYLNLIPTSDGDSLFLEVHGAPQGSLPLSAVVIPGQGAGSPQSTSLAYSTSKGAYTGAVSFAGVGLGSGDLRVIGTPGGQYVAINANYNLQWVGNDQSNELASEDGNLQLYVDPGSLEMGSAEAYATILPTGYVPAPLPDNKQVLASAYTVRFSGAMTQLTKPALLKLNYHPDVIGTVDELAIYHWNAAEQRWQTMNGDTNAVENGLTTPITQLGIYVLGGRGEATSFSLFLPVISSHP